MNEYSLPEPLASRHAKRLRRWDGVLSIDRAAARADLLHVNRGLNRMGDDVANIWPEPS